MQKKNLDITSGARKMNWGSSLIALILLMGMTSSCYWRVNEMEKVEPPPEEISYEVDIQPIWDNAPGSSGAGCTRSGCHQGTVPPDLIEGNSYNNLSFGGYVNTNDPPQSLIFLGDLHFMEAEALVTLAGAPEKLRSLAK